ncbi:unnamed protein product [Closterium sp. Yama58-4]|nr:unnamed protein product [Closterium sp. Yama58-4]
MADSVWAGVGDGQAQGPRQLDVGQVPHGAALDCLPQQDQIFSTGGHGCHVPHNSASAPAVPHPCPLLKPANGSRFPPMCLPLPPPGALPLRCCAVCRPAFERFYGGPILDTTLSPRQKEPMYCPKLLELHTYRQGVILLIDLMQRGPKELSYMRRMGDIVFSRVVPIADLSLNITGFAVALPILQHALPPNPTEQQAEQAVLGAAGANVDLGSIARHVLQNVFTPDPSITFEVYDTTDPKGPTMIYGPGPRLVFYIEHDSLPITDISPENVMRPWEERSVVPLDLLGGRLRHYQVWCRYVESPSAWLSWGVPCLWAALALMVTALIAAVAWQQRVGYMHSQENMAAADLLRAKARAAERSKSSFVASMSHELRTPMLGIVGLLDALEDRRLSAAQLHDVRAARTAAYDTVRLVNRVLDLSKLEARRMPLCCSPFHPQAWLEEVVLGCCERARDKGIEVAGMVDMGVPAVLHMDAMRLTQALNELIDNAMCYTARGHVLVRASVCPATTSLDDFLHHHLYAPLHPSPPPPPRHSWFFPWLTHLHLQLGRLCSAATVTCWGEQEPPDEGEGDEDSSHRAMAGEEEQVGEAKGDDEGDGEGDDAGWGRGGGGEEMQLVLSCADTGCGFDSMGEELSEFKYTIIHPFIWLAAHGTLQGRSESGGAGLGLVLVHQLLTALMLAGLGAHVHVLPCPLDRLQESEARAAEGGTGDAKGSCEDAARAQGGPEEMRDGTCRASGLCGPTDGGMREDGGEGGGAAERASEEEGYPCVVVVNEEDLWWQQGRRAAAGMPWDRDSGATSRQEDFQFGWSGQQGGQGGGEGKGAGVVALAPGEGAAWQAAAVGLNDGDEGGEGVWGNRGDGGDGVEESTTAEGGEEEEEVCDDEGGAGSVGRAGQASPSPCTAPLASLLPGTASVSAAAAAAAAAPHVVVCCRPLLSYRLHRAVQVAAFGVDSKSAWHGSVGCERHESTEPARQDSTEPVRQAQHGRPQESGEERKLSSGRQWGEEKGDEPQQSGNRWDETGGVQPSSCTASRRAGAGGATGAAEAAGGVLMGQRVVVGEERGAGGGYLAGQRVLVVDDTAVNLLVARRTLTRCGASVSTAGSGEEAVRLVAAAVSAASHGAASDASAVLDVVLMDLHMPAMDG